MDEQEKQVIRDEMDRVFMGWIYRPFAHRIYLIIFTLVVGSIFFYGIYGLIKQDHSAPLPLWFWAIEWAVACVGSFVMGELLWRVNRYIDHSMRDSYAYLIIQGIYKWPYRQGKKTKGLEKKP